MLSGCLPNRHKDKIQKFCLPIKTQAVRPEPPTLTPYDIAYAKSPHPYPITARTSRVFLLVLITGQSPWPGLLDLLVRVRYFDDRGTLESFHKSRTARLGSHYSDREHLFLVQSRGASRLVGDFDAYPDREFHHLDHPLHRCGKELRKRRRFWNWLAFATVYFLSDPRLRQRSVSRPFGVARRSRFSATAARL